MEPTSLPTANPTLHTSIIYALKSVVLACDTDTARHYGYIKDHLRAKGNPIPENDIWIAALAKQYHLTLISRDQHFSVIKEIKVEQW